MERRHHQTHRNSANERPSDLSPATGNVTIWGEHPRAKQGGFGHVKGSLTLKTEEKG